MRAAVRLGLDVDRPAVRAAGVTQPVGRRVVVVVLGPRRLFEQIGLGELGLRDQPGDRRSGRTSKLATLSSDST